MSAFDDVLTEAVAYFTEHGYGDAEALAYWQGKLRTAAEQMGGTTFRMDEMLRDAMGSVYRRMVEQDGLLRYHPGVQRWTVDRLRPQLQAELQRRILASADLIKLNRDEMVGKTLRRFSGWATSIPKGGSDAVDRRDVKTEIKKALVSQPYEVRRVMIDQGHKMTAAFNEIVAKDNNALAASWRSHFRQPGYNYREDHAEREGKVYAIRGNWAIEKGLMKVGPDGYYDEIDAAGEKVFCRCWIVYIYTLRQLPADMLSQKGRVALVGARVTA